MFEARLMDDDDDDDRESQDMQSYAVFETRCQLARRARLQL